MIKLPKNKIDWIDEIGSWTGIISVLMLSSNIGMNGLAFTIFTVTSICFVYVAHEKKLNGMRRMNVVMFFINIWGIWRWAIQPWMIGV